MRGVGGLRRDFAKGMRGRPQLRDLVRPCANENDRRDLGSSYINHSKVLRELAACVELAYGVRRLIPLESNKILLNPTRRPRAEAV